MFNKLKSSAVAGCYKNVSCLLMKHEILHVLVSFQHACNMVSFQNIRQKLLFLSD
jgi:hypothetical protein